MIDCIDDEEVEEGRDDSYNESTVSHFADGSRLITAPIVSQHASTESPDGVNNLNSPIVATREVVPSSWLGEEHEHFPISNA